jgi:hypothetical protein
LAGADANQISKEFELVGVQAAMQPRQVKKKEIQRLDWTVLWFVLNGLAA